MKILILIAIYLRLNQNNSILAKNYNYSQEYLIESPISKRSNEYNFGKSFQNYVIHAIEGQSAEILCFQSDWFSNITLPNNSILFNKTSFQIESVSAQNAGKYICNNGEQIQSIIVQIEKNQYYKRLDSLLSSKSFCSLVTNKSNFALKTIGKVYTAFSFCFFIISIIYIARISIRFKGRQTKVNSNELIDSQRSRIFKRRSGVLSASALQTKSKIIVEEVQTTRI